MSDVWIHWAKGFWYVTKDGMDVVDKVQEVALVDVRFVIDPVGLDRMRARGKRSTCAWAIGQRTDPSWDVPRQGEIQRLDFLPARDDHFYVLGGRVSGCRYLYATIGLDGVSRTACLFPEYGDTERRRVQQYGGVR